MKTSIFALLVIASSPMFVMPAAAADIPDSRRVYVAPPPPPRIYVPAYCRIETERFFDGYAWRSRDVQVCR